MVKLNVMKTTIFASVLALVISNCGVSGVVAADILPGSADFRASPEQPVGWRGDGSGHFPGATPSLNWSLKDGKGTNIAWQSLMPFDSPSSVIVVGDKLFTTGNDFELICVEKRTGKILWVKPVSPYDAATGEERAANKELFDKLDQLAQKRNELLAKIPAPGTNSLGALGAEISKTDNAMMKELAASDKVKFKHPGTGEGGFMASTPVSDGKLVCAWNAWGVTACFDLDGNRKWIRFDKLAWQEHGHYASPLMAGDLVIVHLGGRQYLALDKKGGTEAWRMYPEVSPLRNFGSSVRARIGGEDAIVTGAGGLIRASDGRQFGKDCSFGLTPSPVVGDGLAFGLRNSGKTAGYYKLPEKIEDSFKPAVKGNSLAITNAFSFMSSPLYHDGLLYVVIDKSMLYVFDVVAEKLAYRLELPFGEIPTRGDRPYGCGICASPSFAAGKIFLTGNFGATLVIEPGREYKEVSRNTIDQRINYSYKTNALEGTVSCPFFDGNFIFYRAQRYLYCIGKPAQP